MDKIMGLKTLLKKILPICIKRSLIQFVNKTRLTKKSKNDHRIIYQHKDTVNKFKKALYQFSYYNSVDIFINSYLIKSVKPIKIVQSALTENSPILLCITRDNLHTIKTQVEYHRNIGIRHFAYIDNMSKDGTFEWLMEQPDISLFFTDETFHDQLKDAWKRQVTDFFGYNRWYLALDPDELFMYPGIEKKNIVMYINFLESKKIKCVLSPLIDMYSKGNIYENNVYLRDMRERYCYFDVDTYKMEKSNLSYTITGGPRTRAFSIGERKFTCALHKYALIKLSENMLIGTHLNYPYNHNFYTKGAIAFLLHYKFLSEDLKKYEDLLNSGIFLHSEILSFEYKRYVEAYRQNVDLSLYYNGSQKLNDSMDLMKISIIYKKFFKRFLVERQK
jgi:hypothetical protein